MVLEHQVRRRSILVSSLGGAALAAVLLAGCARDREQVQAAENAAIGIETSQLFVTLENKAGVPLTDLDGPIVAVGSQRFTKRLDRLEDGQRQDVSLGDFSGRDGTTFNLRFNTPKSVEVKAIDLTSKKYDVVVPWQ